jgi:subtilase family serine protease
VGAGNLFVRARGTVGNVEQAFQVQLNNYSLNGTIYRAPASDPYVDGAAAGLVRAVSGLDSGAYYSHPVMSRPTTLPGTQPATAPVPSSASPDFFASSCFTGVRTEKYNTGGTFPTGTYTGNGYVQSTASCGYTPPELATAYNLTGLYNEGYDGTGQTIAIIEGCGSLTIQSDANAFSKKFGLPPLTSSNFNIIEFPTPSQCSGGASGWDPEIHIDVEWAHAVAPGANINLVIVPSAGASAFFQDVDEAEAQIVLSGLGNVISGSYAAPESEFALAELATLNLINELAAVAGISANFASGDDGDYTAYGIPPTVSAPADSPWATAVGGVTVALNPDNSIAWQAGWGTNFSYLDDQGYIYNPPFAFFDFGSGGGPSAVFAKPSFQKGVGVPGPYRQLPDISWVADPYTGVAILISEPFQVPAQVWTVYGGTSVACPMFSALWAIANQEAGFPLGQAAAYVYSMPAGAITDIVPIGSTTNVTAVIHESSSTVNTYDAAQVFGGAITGKFYSALWDIPGSEDLVDAISFGTDCTIASSGYGTLCTNSSALKTRVGWDNVTGVGTPNAQAFADSFKPTP